MKEIRKCWCGNENLLEFSAEYRRCNSCESLVAIEIPEPEIDVVKSENQFYGQNYWFSHQEKELGLPNILDRARSDLYDRSPYWLKYMLKYLQPPAKVLEVGCGSGSFSFLMKQAGFDVTGLELSPWIVDFLITTYQLPVLLGSLEQQKIPENSFDSIVMMDVMEHLSNPIKTFRHCSKILKMNGLMMIQTPCYHEGFSYESIKTKQDRFVEVMRDKGHLFLFSRKSVAMLMKKIGFDYIYFENALFSDYDMFFIASRHILNPKSLNDAVALLDNDPSSRLVRALVDLKNEFDAVVEDRNFHMAESTRLKTYLSELENMWSFKILKAYRKILGH